FLRVEEVLISLGKRGIVHPLLRPDGLSGASVGRLRIQGKWHPQAGEIEMGIGIGIGVGALFGGVDARGGNAGAGLRIRESGSLFPFYPAIAIREVTRVLRGRNVLLFFGIEIEKEFLIF